MSYTDGIVASRLINHKLFFFLRYAYFLVNRRTAFKMLESESVGSKCFDRPPRHQTDDMKFTGICGVSWGTSGPPFPIGTCTSPTLNIFAKNSIRFKSEICHKPDMYFWGHCPLFLDKRILVGWRRFCHLLCHYALNKWEAF